MKFSELYKKAIKLWPEQIDISDGKSDVNGIIFRNLSSVWDNAEEKAKVKGEWYDLITWIIFSNFHSIARKNFNKGVMTVRKTEINEEMVKKDLIHSLRSEGYEDMLHDFKKSNSDYPPASASPMSLS